MAERQGHLNGAYYGPLIPPPEKTYHSHSTRGGGGGCCCLRCCGCCILSLICNILVAAIVILAVVALVIWLIFRPTYVKFQVPGANLTRFDFDPTNKDFLNYDLTLNLTIRNPNRRIGVYYDKFEAGGYYGDERFGTVEIPPFYQGHENTTVIGVVFAGKNTVLLGDGGRRDRDEDQRLGIFRIVLKLRLGMRFKFGWVKSWTFKPKLRCNLMVPLSSSNLTSGFQFMESNCRFALWG